MTATLDLVKVNHINAITDGHADTVAHFKNRLGFQLNMAIPDRGDGVEACLMTLGGIMYEFFSPKARGERGQGRLLDRFGDHYIGIEYQVRDVPAAREVCAAHDVRIINDVGHFFFTYPGSCLGIAFELWDGDWHAPHPNNPGFHDVLPESYWRAEHPLGITGLARIGVAVEELDASIATLQTLTGAPLVGKVDRPRAAAVGAQFEVGDAIFELLAPTGDGPVASYLERYGGRIRSTVYRVADLVQAERYLTDQGFSVVPGDADDAIAIPPDQNKNLLFEFTE